MTQDLTALVAALRTQRQIDADGCEVAVSRQACDEAADALEAQAAEIARLTARAEKAEAALSESEALLAVWPEVAATEVEAWGMPSGSAPAAIRALTPADAQAALDAERVRVHNEAVRLCADAAETRMQVCGDFIVLEPACNPNPQQAVKAAILAKIKEADHE